MKLIQITDLHIGDEDEKPYGIDVRKNFLNLLDALREEDFDHLVISGDLCFSDPKEAIYLWIKERLDKITTSYSLISGNHDDNRMINKIFYRQDSSTLYYIKTFQNKPVYFLDSGIGNIDHEQLTWLDKQLENTSSLVLLFMHHPPAICQVPYMDAKHYLKNYTEIQSFFNRYPAQFHIFCGHYHLEKTISHNNMHIHITPSCFFQIDDRYEKFVIGSHQIGYRRIFVENDSIFTSVKYV